MSKIFEQLLEKRGLEQDFLHPKYEASLDPFSLTSIEKAVARIKQAISQDEKIIIYGDYDVDGITSSIIMEQALVLSGVKSDHISIMLPNRFADGYGMSPKLIERAAKEGITLVITVDCGSRNHAIVDELNEQKIDTIITDHHETDDKMPEAIAILNPHRKDAPTRELQNLAGAGVAFKLAQALVREHLIPSGQEKWLLDLVLLGTICDSMTIIGENRRLCYYGLKVLAKTRRPGLIELIKKARITNLNSEAVGFIIGPRLNAAGRLTTADLSLELLRTKTPVEAAPLAEKLERLNAERKRSQQSAINEIEARGVSEEPVIVEVGSWHEGVLGIVAGHLVEKHQKPAFVLTKLKNDVLKGSGRSFGDFNLADALNFAKDSILSGGGHAAAAGVRLEAKNLNRFKGQVNAYYRSLKLQDQLSYLKPKADLALSDFSELSLDLLSELKQLEPFGPGNEEPIFRLKNTQIAGLTRMGAEQNHLRLDLKDKNGKFLKCLAFFAPEAWLELDPDFSSIEPLVRLVENEFNGVRSLEARLVDIAILD